MREFLGQVKSKTDSVCAPSGSHRAFLLFWGGGCVSLWRPKQPIFLRHLKRLANVLWQKLSWAKACLVEGMFMRLMFDGSERNFKYLGRQRLFLLASPKLSWTCWSDSCLLKHGLCFMLSWCNGKLGYLVNFYCSSFPEFCLFRWDEQYAPRTHTQSSFCFWIFCGFWIILFSAVGAVTWPRWYHFVTISPFPPKKSLPAYRQTT